MIGKKVEKNQKRIRQTNNNNTHSKKRRNIQRQYKTQFIVYCAEKHSLYHNGHRSGKFKFYTLSFSAIITGNEVNGFIDFCLKNKVRFLV